jgi:hypothetical protein
MERGYVKLWRKTLDSQVFRSSTPDLLKVWVWCLMKAARQRTWVSAKAGHGTRDILLEPGQFIFGRHSAAKELRLSPDLIRRRLEKLRGMGNLTTKVTSNCTVVTLMEWATYQGDAPAIDQQVDHPMTSPRPPHDHPMTSPNAKTSTQRLAPQRVASTLEGSHKKEEKEEKEEKEKKKEGASDGLTLENLIEGWNIIEGVQAVRKITAIRRKAFCARAADPDWLADVPAALERVKASSFCCGRNDRSWRADLDWFLRPDTLTKILEGKYDDRTERHPKGPRVRESEPCDRFDPARPIKPL